MITIHGERIFRNLLHFNIKQIHCFSECQILVRFWDVNKVGKKESYYDL